MPSGRTHNKATALLFVTTSAVALIIDQPIAIKVSFLCGIFLTFAVNPDLDIARKRVIAHSNIGRILGKPVSWVWRAYWFPYALIIPHRSFLSHSPLFSTILRAAYLAPLWYFLSVHREYLLVALVGMIVSDALHIFLDKLTFD